jgi:hypothetical protein
MAIDQNIKVPVVFTQQGTWGGVNFGGNLYYKHFSLFGEDEEAKDGDDLFSSDELFLEITSGPAPYIGLIIKPNQELPGLFASGYDSPLSGKCFLGELKIGDTAKDLINYSCPESVFSMQASYLHIAENITLTEDQRNLLLDAVRLDKKDKFTAGASIGQIFTKDELEGTKKGQIYYNN